MIEIRRNLQTNRVHNLKKHSLYIRLTFSLILQWSVIKCSLLRKICIQTESKNRIDMGWRTPVLKCGNGHIYRHWAAG